MSENENTQRLKRILEMFPSDPEVVTSTYRGPDRRNGRDRRGERRRTAALPFADDLQILRDDEEEE